MSKHSKSSLRNDSGFVEIKSKFDAEFRRFAVDRNKQNKIESFQETLEKLHFLKDIPFIITYTDIHGDLLPINNDDNFNLALSTAKPVLRILIQRKGESYGENNGYNTAHGKKRNPLIQILSSDNTHVQRQRTIAIGLPEDFRRVSAIIDVDIVPETHRRVKLMKNESDKPLGFYIRDGSSVRVTSQGLEKVPGIFISRLVPGGLAESTGLLAVNDEVIEVNGIEVCGKTLDQVTDMMVANSSNLIITVKPVNQRLTLASANGRHGQSSASGHSRQSSKSFDSDLIMEQDDEDEVKDYLSKPSKGDINKSSKSDRSEKVNRPDTNNFNEHDEKSDKGRSTEKYDKVKPATRLESKNRNNDSNRSNGSDRQSERSNGSDRQSKRSNGSDRQSGRSNDSDWQSCKSNGSGRRKHEDGDSKEESESPGIVL